MNVHDISGGPSIPFEHVRRRDPAHEGVPERERQHIPQNPGPSQPTSSPVSQPPLTLSEEEGRFFEQAYPESAQHIRLRQSYSRTGQASGTVTGTLIDRRG